MDSRNKLQANKIAPSSTPAHSRGSGADGGGDGAKEDAPSTNRASSSYRNEGNIKILLKGIDSLYFSFAGEIDPGISQDLADKKLFAQSKKAEHQARAQWQFENHLFEVSDKGQRSGSGGGFAYILEDAAYRICLSSSGSRAMPLAYAKVSSAYLAHQRPEVIFKELTKIIQGIGNLESSTLSRVDVFVDFQCDFDMEHFPREAWVTRAGAHDTHARGGQFTGYSIGLGGNISARLYNKTLEIKKSNKTYFDELWRRGGVDPERPIWRLEFEISREVIYELRVLSFEHLMDKLGSMWAYATQTWLRLTIPQDRDSNRARWPLHPLWKALSNVRWRLDDEPLIRRFSSARTPSEARLCRFLISYITSFMALKKIQDFGEGAAEAIEAARQMQEAHCSKYLEISFDEWVDHHVAVKAKQYNLPFGKVLPREEVERSDEDELDAFDYSKASRGE